MTHFSNDRPFQLKVTFKNVDQGDSIVVEWMNRDQREVGIEAAVHRACIEPPQCDQGSERQRVARAADQRRQAGIEDRVLDLHGGSVAETSAPLLGSPSITELHRNEIRHLLRASIAQAVGGGRRGAPGRDV